MAAALADDLGDVFLAAFEFVGERVIALRLFQRIEVFALHVLDDRELQRVAVVDVDRDDRHLVQACGLRRAPAPLAGDDLEAVVRALHRTHHDRLDHAVLPDRVGKLGELGFRKRAARVARIGFQEFDRHLALRARPVDMRGLAADVADQTCKTAAQSRTRFVGHRPSSLGFTQPLPLPSPSFRGARSANPESRRCLAFSNIEAAWSTARIAGMTQALLNAAAARARAGSLRSQA